MIKFVVALWMLAFSEAEHFPNVSLACCQPKDLMKLMRFFEDIIPSYGGEYPYKIVPVRDGGGEQKLPEIHFTSCLNGSCWRWALGQFDSELVPISINDRHIDRHIESWGATGVLKFGSNQYLPKVSKFKIRQAINAEVSPCLRLANFPGNGIVVPGGTKGEPKQSSGDHSESHHEPLSDSILADNKPSSDIPPFWFPPVFLISLIVFAGVTSYALGVVIYLIAPYDRD